MQKVTQIVCSRQSPIGGCAAVAVEVRVLRMEDVANVETLEVVSKDTLGRVIVDIPVLVLVRVGPKNVQKVVEANSVGIKLVLVLARQNTRGVAGMAREACRTFSRSFGQSSGLTGTPGACCL